jgi:hypothetical protein
MDSRGKRNVIIASIVAASLLVVTVIGTTVFFVVRNQHRQDDVAEAARVATAYNKKVSAYRSSVEQALNTRQLDDAQRIKVAFDEAVVKTPELGDAPEWGKAHSTSYRAAVKSQKTLKEPYDDVAKVLDEAVVGQPFVKAAKTALKVQINDYVGKGKYFHNGSVFRNKLVPGFKKVLAKFDKVPVPKGRESVARKVDAALNGVIKDGKKAAAELDAGRSTLINARSEYFAASSAVLTYERSLESRLESAIQKAASVVSGQSST